MFGFGLLRAALARLAAFDANAATWEELNERTRQQAGLDNPVVPDARALPLTNGKEVQPGGGPRRGR